MTTRKKRWERRELLKLCEVYGSTEDSDLADRFRCTVEDIERQAVALALQKNKAHPSFKGQMRMPRWTDEEKQRLRRLYPGTRNLDVALELGRSVKSVVSKAHSMGLKKNPARLEEMGRENVHWRYAEHP